ncbi:MAG: hypothetical protein HQM03_11115 [Magnetococcales bacterium]|nr:hypothetical protein [Magnetococcales bacterium]
MRISGAIGMALGVALIALGGCGGKTAPVDTKASTILQRSPVTARTLDLDPGPFLWHQGDQWEYSDGYALQVTRVEGEVATLTRMDRKDEWMQRRSLFREGYRSGKGERKVIYRSADPYTLFPLQTGKSVEFNREFMQDQKLQVHKTSWIVLGQETVQVPAGRYDCWVLLWRSESLHSDWTGEEKLWYSPLVGNFVRMEFQYGNAPASSRVLMKYRKIK